jgi:hypothetical protein
MKKRSSGSFSSNGKNPFVVSISLVVVLFLFFTNCNKSDDGDDEPSPNNSVNQYIVSLPSWDNFCPTKADSDEAFDASLEFDCTTKIVQTTTPCSITRTPAEIVTYDPGSEILYLGSLIQGSGYIGGLGSIKSLPIYQRAPLSISISFQMAGNSRDVENPDLTSVNEAIGDLVETAQNTGHVSGSSIYYDKRICYSVEQTALALGLSFKYMAGSARTQLQYQSTSETSTVSAYFVQKMFTVSMGIPQRPSDLFSSEFTQELLNEQINLGRIGPDNLPVYVSNIVYGRMMMLTMTSTYNETEIKAALEASYYGIGGSVSAEHLTILQNSQIKMVTIGGEQTAALNYLKTGQLGEFFKDDAPLTTAVPISYTLRNLGDNDIACVSETTDYDMVQNEIVSVQILYDEASWRDAVQMKTMTVGVWESTLENLQKANEAYKFEYYGVQTLMFEIITFPGSVTQFPFEFHLKNLAVTGDRLALVHNDTEGLNNNFTTNTISIGDIDDFENDDFEIVVTGDQVYAIGFIMRSNTDTPEEFLEVFAQQDDCYLDQKDLPNGNNTFVGVISPVPIKRNWFNEDDDDDDMGIENFYFGYRSK